MRYKGYSVNAGDNDQYPMNFEILDAIISRFEYMHQKLSQLFIIRFDLHFPEESEIDPIANSKKVSEFFNRLVQKKLKRGKGKHRHIQHFWVREVEKAKKAHYHCFIIVDKHLLDSVGSLQNRTGFYGMASSIWSDVSNGGHLQVSDRAKNGLVIRSSCKEERDEQIQDVMYGLSYLAKQRGKGVRYGTTVRDYGGSRIEKAITIQ